MLTAADDFAQFMFKGNIAAGAVAYGVGLASTELSKSVTMSLLLPALRATGLAPFIGADVTFDLAAIATMCVYWLSMICTCYFLTEFVFGRWMMGTKTVLDPGEARALEEARERARTCPGLVRSMLS